MAGVERRAMDEMGRFRDLPVAVELPARLGQEVAGFVEVEAGWQVVSPTGPPHPVLVLATTARPGTASVVVVEGTPAPAQVRAELLAGALDVVAWPDDRDRLLEAPLRIRSAGRRGPHPRLIRIAGLAGGVGTSTVALAVGGLLAWSGRRVIVAGGDDLLRLTGQPPWSGPGTVEIAALGQRDVRREVDDLVRAVAGVDRLSAIGGGGRAVVSSAGWSADVVVADVGRATADRRPDLLVARPDAALRAAAAGGGVPRGGTVVVVGDAPLGRTSVRRLLAGSSLVAVPSSARVARAAVAGRVPSGLPGSWLATLRPAVRGAAP